MMFTHLNKRNAAKIVMTAGLLLGVQCHAQVTVLADTSSENNEVRVDKDSIPLESEILYIEEMPEYPGGQDSFFAFVKRHLKYPAKAKKAAIQGKVFVSFIITASGKIKSVEIARGIGYDCDEEAVRVVKKVRKWIPGKNWEGKKVDMRVSVPIAFKLD